MRQSFVVRGRLRAVKWCRMQATPEYGLRTRNTGKTRSGGQLQREVGRITHPGISVDVRARGLDISRNGGVVTRPEPDLDERGRALHRVKPSAGGVERLAEAVRRSRLNAAPRVPVDIHVAVVRDRVAGHCAPGRGLRTVRARVQRRLVRLDVVRALQLSCAKEG